MSTLTKVLIVLLTVLSIFLCGIVVTYVANAENYSQQSEQYRVRLQAAEQNKRSAEQRERQAKTKYEEAEKTLNEQIAALKIDISDLEAKLNAAEREKANLLQKATDMASLAETDSQTALQQTKLYEQAKKELEKIRAEQIKQTKELKETTATLIEKMAIITTLQQQRRRLTEEKTELQNKLDQFLRQYGKVLAPPTPVTEVKAKARPAPAARPVTKEIGLKGVVTGVDAKNRLAEISIGSANGVKEGMKFHVIRGQEFICDIMIDYVEPERSVGWLELVQKQPKAGDIVATNL